jgi:hypothetical protein
MIDTVIIAAIYHAYTRTICKTMGGDVQYGIIIGMSIHVRMHVGTYRKLVMCNGWMFYVEWQISMNIVMVYADCTCKYGSINGYADVHYVHRQDGSLQDHVYYVHVCTGGVLTVSYMYM